jgi:hypothetical protein
MTTKMMEEANWIPNVPKAVAEIKVSFFFGKIKLTKNPIIGIQIKIDRFMIINFD